MLVSFIAAVIGWIWMLRLPSGGALTGLFTIFLLFGGLGWVTYFVMKLMSASSDDDHGTQQDQTDESSMGHPMSPAVEVLTPPIKSLSTLVYTFDLSPDLKRVMQDLLDRMSEIGISLGACYAVTDSAEDLKRLIDSWLITFPLDHFKSEEAWCEVIYRQTLHRFLSAIGQTHACLERVMLAGYSGDKIPTTLEPISRLFPMKADESFSDYLERLGIVIQRLSSMVSSELPGAQS